MAPTPPSRDDEHAETKVADDTARLQLAIDSAALGIYEWDVGASESRWDDRVYELWGATPGTPATFELILAGVHPDDRETVKANLAAMIDNPDFRTESRIIGIENGVQRTVELTHKVLYEDGVPRRVIGTVRDVTRERSQQREIERLTRLYAALSHVNKAIVHAATQEQLLGDICLALVQQGGFRFAWIARLDGADLRPLGSSADPGTMLADLRECAATAALDCCPTMTALRDGATSVCNDVRTEAMSGGWRERAAARGHLSAAAFPIRRDGITTSALSVFASEADVFGPQELELLEEAAVDVAFGLQHIEMQAARVEAERAMRLWTDAFCYCSHGIAIGDPREERVLACNPAYAAIVRRTVDEIRSTPISALYTPLSNARLHEAMAQSDRTGSASREVEMMRSDGSSVPVLLNLVSVRDGAGAVAYRVATVQDITETALAKASLRDYAQRFQLAAASARLGVYDWTVRTDGLVWDERMYEIHGVSRQTFQPSYEAWRAMIHPDDRDGTTEAVTRALAGGAPLDTEFRIVRPDGSIVRVKADATVIRDAEGAAVRMVGVNRDVTAERHASAAHA